jgi:uncharacterized damage-inducible protein DinB
MTFSEMILPEFDREMASTRRTIERVPDDKLDWQPHTKSTSMRGLATHLSNIPTWATYGVTLDSLDIAPQGNPLRAAPVASTQEALDLFDKNVASAREAIAGASDELLSKPWSLLRDGQTLMSMPRIVVLRNFVLNHLIHHRAQLGVYLRLNDIPVPSIYGPSADEALM